MNGPIDPHIWFYDHETRIGMCIRHDEDGERLIVYYAHRSGGHPPVANEMIITHRAMGFSEQTAACGWDDTVTPLHETPSLWALAEAHRGEADRTPRAANDRSSVQRSAVAA